MRLSFCGFIVPLMVVALAGSGCAKKQEAGGASTSSGGRSGRGSGSQAQPVEVAAVQQRDLVETLTLVGTLAPNESAELRAEIPGQVKAILFEEGSRVAKGQVLIKIDDAELLAQRVQNEAQYKLAELNLQRAENLRKSNSNTQADYDRARSECTTAEAELALLRLRLEKTEVKAPFAGVVAGRTISVGDYVNTTSVITRVTDLDRMKIEFQVPERYLSKVKPGTTFKVQSKSAESAGVVPGEVYYVNSVIDRNSRSTEVKGLLANPPAELKAGMFVNVELVLEVRRGALTVPESAVLMAQEGPQVITVVEKNGDKVAAFVPVKLGLRSRGLVEVIPVKGELSVKQTVVATGVGSLVIVNGIKLEPQPLRAEFRVGDQ